MYTRPHNNDDTDYLETHIVSASIFDGDPWYISFGRIRSDDEIFYKSRELVHTPSSSYFLRCGKVGTGKANIYFATSSFYSVPDDTDSFFTTVSDSYNSSGPFILIGDI